MITYRPVAYAPVELAPDVHLIRQACAAAGDDSTVYMSSLLITGSEPVLVDTGPPVARDVWFDAVWSLVDPEDVRWVFVSHDDIDHIGNLMNVLAMCPNATLLTTAFAVSRSVAAFDLPYERMHWLNVGESLEVGDRTIDVVETPVFDSPTTAGLHDRSSGVTWAADSFAAPVPVKDPPAWAEDADQAQWEAALPVLGIGGAPWLCGIQADWFHARLDDLMSRHPSVVASCHGPALRGASLQRAVELYRTLPGGHATPPAEQAQLEALLRAHHP
jgi:glyoxylase-like metal-dependent hydrolase (beta-lactamase superfamily II)